MRTNNINMDDFYSSYYDKYIAGNTKRLDMEVSESVQKINSGDAVKSDISEEGKNKCAIFTTMNVNITAGKAYW